MKSLAGKRVLLTGATGGIGQAVLKQLLQLQASVVISSRSSSKLAELQATAPQHILAVTADITDEAGRQALFNFCRQHGGIDVLINNAGISQFAEASGQHIEALLNTNLLAPVRLCQLFLPMLQQRSGTILNVGSAFGSIGYPGFSGYCAAKFGLRGYTEALSRELSDSNVKVLYFAPRATQTGINSSQVDAMNKALGQGVDSPDYVAMALAEQLISGKRRYYVGWPEKIFVRLNGVFPAVVDNALGSKLKQIKQFFVTKPVEV